MYNFVIVKIFYKLNIVRSIFHNLNYQSVYHESERHERQSADMTIST